ncbi:hypothetical protein JCM19379_11980 [Methyloparacoccus murrellii]
MTESERLLAELEATVNRQRREGRALVKSLSAGRYTGRTRRPDFGRQDQPLDLVKAQLTLNHLHRAGKLTDEQAGKAQARLMALRPTEIIRLK